MKLKYLITLGLVPLALTSCGSGSLTLDQMKEYINNIDDSAAYPFYRVIGACDYNNEFIEVDREFTKDYRPQEYVAYTRYNPGTYDPDFDIAEDEENTLNFNDGSKAYWSRMPMRLTKNNFYGEIDDGKQVKINSTCSYYQLFHYMKTWSDSQVKNADAGGEVVMNVIKDDKGEVSKFVFYGENLHSKILINNFPLYADPADTQHFPDGIYYSIVGPAPMYQNEIDGTFNFRFEYNKDGWLTREYIASVNYNSKDSNDTQFCAEAIYSYLFE